MNWQRAIITSAVACALAVPGLAGAEPPSDAAVRIDVDVSALPKHRITDHVQNWVRKEQTAVFEGAGFVVSDVAPQVVRIEISRYGEDGIHSKARLMLVGDEGSTREFNCEACMDSQLVEKVRQETALLVEHMRSRAVAEQSAEPEPAVEPEPQPEEAVAARGELGAADDMVDREGARLGPAGFAGIGALALGAGMTIGGAIVLAEKPRERLQGSSARFIETVHRRPLGGTLTGVGAGLLVTGIVLTVVDQTVLRKRRAHGRQAAALAPSLLPNGAGLLWTGRF